MIFSMDFNISNWKWEARERGLQVGDIYREMSLRVRSIEREIRKRKQSRRRRGEKK